jgi:hypothetical protein
MRQTIVLPTPRWSLGGGVCAGCRESLLTHGPSRHDLCHLCSGAWTYPPPCSSGARTHYFPNDSGLTSRETRSAHGNIPAKRCQQGAYFRGCSHALMFRLPHLLGLQIAPTAVYKTGQPGRVRHASPQGLPTSGCGIATCLIWAIDMAGLPPARWQPCRLLLPALRFPVCFV